VGKQLIPSSTTLAADPMRVSPSTDESDDAEQHLAFGEGAEESIGNDVKDERNEPLWGACFAAAATLGSSWAGSMLKTARLKQRRGGQAGEQGDDGQQIKSPIAFSNVLPISFESLRLVMPLTMVQKTIGPCRLDELDERVSQGLQEAPNSGRNARRSCRTSDDRKYRAL
jgi:hypothetical protein